MIAKECASLRQEGEQENLVQPKYRTCSYLNLSIVDLEGKILTYLCAHKGWISTHRLFEKLGLEIMGMNTAARAIHNLGRRGIVEIRANAVRAARGLRRVKE